MKDSLAAFSRYGLTSLVLSAAFTFAATSVSAQSVRPPRGADSARAERIIIERDLADREWQLRNIGKVVKKDVEVAPPRVSLKNIKEDYEGLQVANNSILKMMSQNNGLDYKVVADATSQIKKRAGRLKSYLMFLKVVEDKKREKNRDDIVPERMASSLLTLDASIMRLITNPVFLNIGKVVDVDNSAKASEELENIIELSERIKKTAERSMKEVRASR